MDWQLSLRALVRGRRRGDAVIEFVLLAPILLTMLLGILEVGRVVDAWLVVTNAAREGARVAAQAPNGTDPASAGQQAALAYLSSGLAPRGDVAGTSVAPPAVTSDTVTVSTEADIRLYTPLFQSILPSPVPVRASASMRRQ
jgi:Flp pilus assembly protein TadG